MAYFGDMTRTENLNITQQSLQLSQQHYENFPVASVLMPKKLRAPIALIYSFARQADDIADEGDASETERLQGLQAFKNELDLIEAYIQPNLPLFKALSTTIQTHKLPLQPFYDLLDAFSQDVTKTRYANFAEVQDYCRRSANPIGRLLLHLYGQATPQNLAYADNICTALQLINFYQDVAIDFAKNDGKRRIYLCQDELEKFNLNNALAQHAGSKTYAEFMQFNLQRAEQLLHAGKPLGRELKGRISLEMRLIIAGGQTIINKLKQQPNVFAKRPVLNGFDWAKMLIQAIF